jgi:hypothetical protein
VSVGVFLVVFAVSAGALALWVDHRFPRLAPRTLRAALLHVGASIVVAQLIVPIGMRVVAAGPSDAATLLGVFGIGLPGLTYSLLAAVWIMKTVHRTLRGLPH